MNATFLTPKCCSKQSVANMDHRQGRCTDGVQMINRVCLRCGQHWYGVDGVSVIEYSRKAWDRSLQEEIPQKAHLNESRSCANCKHRQGDRCHSGEFEDYTAFPLPIALADVCEAHNLARVGGEA